MQLPKFLKTCTRNVTATSKIKNDEILRLTPSVHTPSPKDNDCLERKRLRDHEINHDVIVEAPPASDVPCEMKEEPPVMRPILQFSRTDTQFQL